MSQIFLVCFSSRTVQRGKSGQGREDYDSSGQNEYNFSKPYSEDTALTIDKEISNLIEGQYQRAINILQENKDKLVQLADILIEKEVLFKDDLEQIFGKRLFGDQSLATELPAGATGHISPEEA